MKSLRAIAVLAGLSLVRGGSRLAKTISKRGFDNPTPENFLRRCFATIAVLDGYVYIDGGEVSQLIDGEVDKKHPSYLVNTTLSLSLASSWTNASVILRSIPKSAPRQNVPITWINAPRSSFYEWGGCTFQTAPPDNLIWKFIADGKGGGEWSQVAPSNIVVFNNAARPWNAGFTTHDSVGYALGGIISSESQVTGGDRTAISGLVSFDMGSLKWGNAPSVGGYGNSGTSWAGRMESIPFGQNGLLMVLGGCESSTANLKSATLVSWDVVNFVDPRTGVWYSQATTGSRPTSRQAFCSAGVQGPNGTYEIFIYGGSLGGQSQSAGADMYVLSLPSFVFFKLPNSGTPRTSHACALVGPLAKGRNKRVPRQMLSVGGTAGRNGQINSNYSSQYDADVDSYDTPRMIQDWYSQGGLDAVSWNTKDIKSMFTSGMNTGTSPGNKTSAAPSSTLTSPPATPESDSESSSSKPISAGAIAGGTIAGVAGIALLTTLAVLFPRCRRARQGQTPQQSPAQWSKPGLSSEADSMQQNHDGLEMPQPQQGLHCTELHSTH
ncbi:hypothetical protein PG993_013897, partial [Apiospora rasikravindrae]